jgi:hypothetical protein
MSDTLVLEHLRAIRTDIADLKFDVRDVKHRLTVVEPTLSGFMAAEASHYASLAQRAERTDERLDRIARRLELAAA